MRGRTRTGCATAPRAAALVAMALASLVGCGTDDGVAGEADEAPITSRAMAAIALDHLDAIPTSLEASYLDGNDAEGAIGADLEFLADDGHASSFVRVYLTPEEPKIFCTEGRCEHRDVEDGSLWLSWGLVEPEEDPGGVTVTLVRPRESVVVHYSGDDITGDPRNLDLPITPEQLEEIAQDPRLSLTTTQEIVDVGEALGGWGPQETPGDEPSIRRVPADADSLAAFWRTALEWAGATPPRIRAVTDSPAVGELGLGPDPGDVVSARVTLRPTRDRPYRTLDLFVTEEAPAEASAPVCPSRTFTLCTTSGANPDHDTYTLVDPGPGGVVWVLYQRDDAYLTARLAGWRIPEDAALVQQQVDGDALLQAFAYTDFFGFETTPEFADMPMP